MLTESEASQESRPKRRIGRAQFFLEFFVAAALIKVGSTGAGILFLILMSIGAVLAFWASIRRLRDIKRSEWWVMVLIAPAIIGIILGATSQAEAMAAGTTLLGRVIWGAYMVIYFNYVILLIFWPSAYRTKNGGTTSTSAQANGERAIAASQATTPSATNSPGAGILQRAHLNRLNGWQRIGIALSLSWCVWVMADSYSQYRHAVSYNKMIVRCCEEEKLRPPKAQLDPRRGRTLCEIYQQCSGTLKPTLPEPVAFFQLLLLPIAAGWAFVLLGISTIKWIRAGFRNT